MSRPTKNNNNKKWHNQPEFSYFNNPNYFGFYNQNKDWNNTYTPSYNYNTKNESFGWDNNPTPTYYYHHNYSHPNYNMNNQTYHNMNNQSYQSNQPYHNIQKKKMFQRIHITRSLIKSIQKKMMSVKILEN